MAKRNAPPNFLVNRDEEKCILCQACARMCSNDVHKYDEDFNNIISENSKCVGCHFCESICPTGALTINRNPSEFRLNAYWDDRTLKNLIKQANSGGILLTGMGCDKA
ncbi:MAG TPA: 4Fe-4S binding protein, partial [bacterium]|nr:4Fe-4S binding protein [bacterium]